MRFFVVSLVLCILSILAGCSSGGMFVEMEREAQAQPQPEPPAQALGQDRAPKKAYQPARTPDEDEYGARAQGEAPHAVDSDDSDLEAEELRLRKEIERMEQERRIKALRAKRDELERENVESQSKAEATQKPPEKLKKRGNRELITDSLGFVLSFTKGDPSVLTFDAGTEKSLKKDQIIEVRQNGSVVCLASIVRVGSKKSMAYIKADQWQGAVVQINKDDPVYVQDAE